MSQINVTTIRNRTGGPPELDKGVVVTGIVTATTGNITGNLTVGGSVSYEDVTNVDAVGIITAQSGIELGASGVGGTMTASGYGTLEGGLNVVGVVTATSFAGDGSSLTGIESWNQQDTWLYGGG